LLNKRYKATMLSIKQQMGKIFESCMIFGLGFVMVHSFNIGFLVAGASMFVILLMVYPFMCSCLK